MVSTRGIKTKFSDGEKVLCYEPDPTKAKVLYESKVKDVVINKSRKLVEYLIHFRGWNSSWDRCVNEEYILKDTPENRQLQKDLAEKSKLQFGAYLYRKDKERKKHGRKNSGALSSTSEDTNRERDLDIDDNPIEHMDDYQQMHPSRDKDKIAAVSPSRSSCSEGEDCSVSVDGDHTSLSLYLSLELTSELRFFLEQDYRIVTQDYKLHRIPAEPNVVTILELYWRYYAANQLCQLHERSKVSSCITPTVGASKGGKMPSTSHVNVPCVITRDKLRSDDVKRNLDICQEVLDGLRIYFDFTLQDLLLYNHEVGQIETGQAISLPQHKVKSEKVKQEGEDQEYAHLPSLEEDSDVGPEVDDGLSGQYGEVGAMGRRRSLRSYRSLDNKLHLPMLLHPVHLGTATNIPAFNISITKSEYSSNSRSVDQTSQIIHNSTSDMKIPTWRAIPDYIYVQRPPPPSLLYGATHLTRLLVKLPDLLAATSMSEEKLKILMGHLELFIDFLSEHREWFLDKCYI